MQFLYGEDGMDAVKIESQPHMKHCRAVVQRRLVAAVVWALHTCCYTEHGMCVCLYMWVWVWVCLVAGV